MNKEINQQKFIRIFLILYCFFLLIFALANGADTMFKGLIAIINHSAALVVDYMVVGGISGAFFNSFLVTSFGITLLFLSRARLTGVSIAAIMMLSGFALFGKNIMNILPIILGVYLFDVITKAKTKTNIHVALFGTALGPIVTEIFIQVNADILIKILASYSAGIFLGFMLTPVSKHVITVHKGFDLYNIGFTDGVIAICFISFLRMLGFDNVSNSMHDEVNKNLFLITLLSFCSLLIIMGLIGNKNIFKGQLMINKESGVGMPNFIDKVGMHATLINMGISGIVTTLFMYFMNVPLNGPTVGTIVSIVGFCSCGNNLRNISYIYIASFIGQTLGWWDIASSNTAALATLLGTGLAPLGGHYGIVAGIVSGIIHISVSHFTSPLHLGLNLYNNGFVAGFVSMTLVPLFELGARSRRRFIIARNLFLESKKNESIK